MHMSMYAWSADSCVCHAHTVATCSHPVPSHAYRCQVIVNMICSYQVFAQPVFAMVEDWVARRFLHMRHPVESTVEAAAARESIGEGSRGERGMLN